MRIVDHFDRAVRMYGENLALDDGHLALTYKAAGALTHQLAGALRNAGFGPGTKVGILSPNASIAMVGVLGVLRAELTWLPLNTRSPIEVNVDLLKRFGGELLIFHSQYEELVPDIMRALPDMRAAMCLDGDSEHGESLPGLMKKACDDFPDCDDDPNGVVGIFPTGGTTGPSKGTIMTNLQVEVMIANMHAHLTFDDGDRHLLVAPMTHAAGLLGFLFFAVGGLNQIMSKVEPTKIMAAIEEHGITHLYLPPTVIQMMLAEPTVADYDYSSLKHFMVGAAPIPVAKFVEAVETFGPMTEIFGQMEAPCCITLKVPGDYLREDGSVDMKRARSAGRSTMFTKVQLFDDDFKPVSAGERGEICVRGNLVMNSYYKDPDSTVAAKKDGWLRTGDVGIQDEDGYITIVDRKKDMIITGGFNVYPNEVEQVIGEYPGVQDCAVIGVPDDKWGERVTGVVQMKESANDVSEEEMIVFIKKRIGSVAAPKNIDFVADLPRSANGKVLKTEIRKQYWKNRDNALV
jgi:acyl-CoA synthetase (AMP-forming)/AMP-acid ligase II